MSNTILTLREMVMTRDVNDGNISSLEGVAFRGDFVVLENWVFIRPREFSCGSPRALDLEKFSGRVVRPYTLTEGPR
jgi:hypothetical protein